MKNNPSFSTLGLCEPLMRAIDRQGYREPSPIQSRAIPAILSGRDVLAAAQTGTGKTAGFTLPLLQLLNAGPFNQSGSVRALVLTPTRELAAQIADSITQYGQYLALRSTVVFGGVGIGPQKNKLRTGVDILTATPGRLLDLHSQGCLDFSRLEILVLDEADRMLDMGFIHDIRKILSFLPDRRQNLLFSATITSDVRRMSGGILQTPVCIEIAPRQKTAENIQQVIHPVDKSRKPKLLCDLIHKGNWEQVLVFTRTKHGANRLSSFLERNGIKAAAIHSNKSQGARTQTLAKFKKGKLRVLVATDIAARGLDIEQLPQVVNFDLPSVAEDYIHRIGRTGRAGRTGQAVSLVSVDERKSLAGIEKLLRQSLTSVTVDGFEPDTKSTPAPETDLSPAREPDRPFPKNRKQKRSSKAVVWPPKHRRARAGA